MTEFPKVLVVDSGRRAPESALAAELAEMGFASVTAPFEAADEVLAMMSSPVAVVLQMSRPADSAERARFLALAARLRQSLGPNGAPVIMAGGLNGAAAMLQDQLGARAVAQKPVL